MQLFIQAYGKKALLLLSDEKVNKTKGMKTSKAKSKKKKESEKDRQQEVKF